MRKDRFGIVPNPWDAAVSDQSCWYLPRQWGEDNIGLDNKRRDAVNFCISEKAGRQQRGPFSHSTFPAWAGLSSLMAQQQEQNLPGLFLPCRPRVPHTRWDVSPQGGCTAPGWWLIKHQAFPWDAAALISYIICLKWVKRRLHKSSKNLVNYNFFFLEALLSSYPELHHYSFQKYRSFPGYPLFQSFPRYGQLCLCRPTGK